MVYRKVYNKWDTMGKIVSPSPITSSIGQMGLGAGG